MPGTILVKATFVLLVALLLTPKVMAQSNRTYATADWALINGKIHTMDADGTVTEAIAVDGDEIVYVGDASGLPKYIGIGTEVIDLGGSMVLPGFVDGHIHTIAGALLKKGIDLQSDDTEEIFARLRAFVAESDDEVILGNGIRFNPWGDDRPTAAMLDEIESERPIYLWAIDGHAAWVNSKALEVAGITKDTPDTVPGFSFFQRDEEGNPTGWVVELPAQMQVFSALLDVEPNFFREGLLEWAPRFSAAGLTTVRDLGVQGLDQAQGYRMMAEMTAIGELPLRVGGVYYWNDPSIDPLPELAELQDRVSGVPGSLVDVAALKINLDGGDPEYNALYVEPYTDRPDIVPTPIIPFDILNDVVQRADAAGIDTVCHCFGDLAVRRMLDAIEMAMRANPDPDRRHVITHATIVHPEDRARFGELGVPYDTTGAWMSWDPLLQTVSTNRLGAERVQSMFSVNPIIEGGGNFSLGSDWPVSGWISEYRPLTAIETAVTRTIDGRKDVELLGGEAAKVPLDVAIRGHTINAAYGMGYDGVVGSLEPGKKADIVVLAEDLYEVTPDNISEVEVLYTIMGGRLVYDHDADVVAAD